MGTKATFKSGRKSVKLIVSVPLITILIFFNSKIIIGQVEEDTQNKGASILKGNQQRTGQSFTERVVYSKLFPSDFLQFNPAYVGMFDKINVLAYTNFMYLSTGNYLNKNDLVERQFRVAMNFPLRKIHSGIGIYSNFLNMPFEKGGYDNTIDVGILLGFNYVVSKNISLNAGVNGSIYRKNYKAVLR